MSASSATAVPVRAIIAHKHTPSVATKCMVRGNVDAVELNDERAVEFRPTDGDAGRLVRAVDALTPPPGDTGPTTTIVGCCCCCGDCCCCCCVRDIVLTRKLTSCLASVPALV